jgi:hypothetical protein
MKVKPKESKEIETPASKLEKDLNDALDEVDARSDESYSHQSNINNAFENIQEKLF